MGFRVRHRAGEQEDAHGATRKHRIVRVPYTPIPASILAVDPRVPSAKTPAPPAAGVGVGDAHQGVGFRV